MAKQQTLNKDDFVQKLSDTLDEKVRRGFKKPVVLTVSVTPMDSYCFMLFATFEKNHSRWPKQYMHYHHVEEPSINYAEEHAEKFLDQVYRKIPMRNRPHGQKLKLKPDHIHTYNSGNYVATF